MLVMQVLPQDFSLEDTALFFARAGAAAYDASIAAWKVKYSTLHWWVTVHWLQIIFFQRGLSSPRLVVDV